MGSLTAVDPWERYAHPRNAPIMSLLKKTAVMGKGEIYELEGYELHTHPDLCEAFEALNRPCYGGVYGVPVLADRGVIFAVARGTSFIAFQLPEPERSEARAAGGKEFPEAGDDWISVEGWRTETDLMAKWCRAAHAYANTIAEGKTP
jgi:hypothetical protein